MYSKLRRLSSSGLLFFTSGPASLLRSATPCTFYPSYKPSALVISLRYAQITNCLICPDLFAV